MALSSSSLHGRTGEEPSGAGGGLRKGEKEPGGVGDRFPAAVRPGAVQGDLATEAVGQRRRRPWAGDPEARR